MLDASIFLLSTVATIAGATALAYAYLRHQRRASPGAAMSPLDAGGRPTEEALAPASDGCAEEPELGALQEPQSHNAGECRQKATLTSAHIESAALVAAKDPAISLFARPQDPAPPSAEPLPNQPESQAHTPEREPAAAPDHSGSGEPRAEGQAAPPGLFLTAPEAGRSCEPGAHQAGSARAPARKDSSPSQRTVFLPADEPPPAATATDGHDGSAGTILPAAPTRLHRDRPAVHRDRRGARRSIPANRTGEQAPLPSAALRQAEARIRLTIDRIRRTVRLSIVLSRPDGFPEQTGVDADGQQTVSAYDESRYDDIDCTWSATLLDGELRLSDPGQGLEWVRSARPIHIFAPADPDFLSVPAARAGLEHIIVSREENAQDIEAAADMAGSSPLWQITSWTGMPAGWTIFTGYAPLRPVPSLTDPRLRSLEPGSGTEIYFQDGLRVRGNQFAEGHPPRIVIDPLPTGATVLIGGRSAARDDGGAWTAPGWEQPGSHLVDVIGGPSLSYSVESDPGADGDWPLPDDHEPFGNPPPFPAAILGAYIRALSHAAIVAASADATISVAAVGHRAGAQALATRVDIPAAVGALPFSPAFLLISWGPRRRQGRILYIAGPTAAALRTRHPTDEKWAAAILAVAGRRLDVLPDNAAARRAWRSAVTAARRVGRRNR